MGMDRSMSSSIAKLPREYLALMRIELDLIFFRKSLIFIQISPGPEQ
jgi:hypothetical protein